MSCNNLCNFMIELIIFIFQATPENLKTFYKAIIEDPRLIPSSTANYSKAFIEAFQLLANVC